jgi:hypothetical protein
MRSLEESSIVADEETKTRYRTNSFAFWISSFVVDVLSFVVWFLWVEHPSQTRTTPLYVRTTRKV